MLISIEQISAESGQFQGSFEQKSMSAFDLEFRRFDLEFCRFDAEFRRSKAEFSSCFKDCRRSDLEFSLFRCRFSSCRSRISVCVLMSVCSFCTCPNAFSVIVQQAFVPKAPETCAMSGHRQRPSPQTRVRGGS